MACAAAPAFYLYLTTANKYTITLEDDMKIYAYGRASTEKQAITEDAQRYNCAKAIADQYGTDDFQWLYDEATSGTTELLERPQGRLLWYGTEPGDVIVFSRLDRMFRNGSDGLKTLEMMQAKGVDLRLASMMGVDFMRAESTMVWYSMLGVSVTERLLIATRTSEAIQSLKRSGKRYGRHCPIGWKRWRDTFEPDMEERKQVEDLFRMREKGMSLRKIEIKYFKHKRTRGTKWDRNTIRLALIAREHNFPKLQPVMS